jgi:hypothetical protein
LSASALRELIVARVALAQLPNGVHAAFLPLVIVQPSLTAMARQGLWRPGPEHALSALRRISLIGWAHLRRRI